MILVFFAGKILVDQSDIFSKRTVCYIFNNPCKHLDKNECDDYKDLCILKEIGLI